MFATDIHNRSPKTFQPDKMFTLAFVFVACFWMVAVRLSGIAVPSDMPVVPTMQVFHAGGGIWWGDGELELAAIIRDTTTIF